MKTSFTLLCLALGACALAQFTVHQGRPSKPDSQDSKAIQKATITVDNGFSPSVIKVHAGHRVLLTFDTKHRGCASTVVFGDLKITKHLEDGKKTTVAFTPKKSGVITYACGMNMLRGTIVVN